MSRYVSPGGFHRHECPDCGCVWEHRDPDSPTKPACHGRIGDGHTCPGCRIGYSTRWYEGPAAPTFTTFPKAIP